MKKILLPLLLAALLCAGAVLPCAAAAGDFNADGVTDVRDLILLRASLAQIAGADADPAADMNGDGKIDGRDLALLKRVPQAQTPAADLSESKYADAALWAFRETEKDAGVDTFFLCPTAVTGDFINMPVTDEALAGKFALQVQNQKGIYDDGTRFFAPVYAQVTLDCYNRDVNARQPFLELAYADVREAFEYYMKYYNHGNAVILAGSSQGADMALRLVRDYFNDAKSAKQLVACYAIGWKVTEEYLAGLDYIRFASRADDTGVIVSFNCEAPEITSSLIVGADEKTRCINPLTWTVTGEEAPRELNPGCCIYSTKGYQKGDDLVAFCGAYVDPVRGTLKVTGVEEQDPDRSLYPSRIDGQPYGVYHVYDWEFFYRSLEANVQTRIAAYTAAQNKTE